MCHAGGRGVAHFRDGGEAIIAEASGRAFWRTMVFEIAPLCSSSAAVTVSVVGEVTYGGFVLGVLRVDGQPEDPSVHC